MAAGLAGIWNADRHVSTQATNGSSPGKTGSADGNTATIAANDFLTLLVTEMKNQDPTASTDPNEYVNQLVQVNSLQQLISINETLQKAVPATSGTTQNPSSEFSGASDARDVGVSIPGETADKMGANNRSTTALRIATALTR